LPGGSSGCRHGRRRAGSAWPAPPSPPLAGRLHRWSRSAGSRSAAGRRRGRCCPGASPNGSGRCPRRPAPAPSAASPAPCRPSARPCRPATGPASAARRCGSSRSSGWPSACRSPPTSPPAARPDRPAPAPSASTPAPRPWVRPGPCSRSAAGRARERRGGGSWFELLRLSLAEQIAGRIVLDALDHLVALADQAAQLAHGRADLAQAVLAEIGDGLAVPAEDGGGVLAGRFQPGPGAVQVPDPAGQLLHQVLVDAGDGVVGAGQGLVQALGGAAGVAQQGGDLLTLGGDGAGDLVLLLHG